MYHVSVGNRSRFHLGGTLSKISLDQTFTVLLALLTVISTCFLQVQSSLMVTPNHLLLSTTSDLCPCNW